MRPYKALFLDFDGTLADTAPRIVWTMERTFMDLGKEVPGKESIRRTIGMPLWKGIQQLGGMREDEALKAADVYRKNFALYDLGGTVLFEGVESTLRTVHREGIRLAICTSRSLDTMRAMLEETDLYRLFETQVTIRDNLPAKPAPDMVLALLERMKLEKEEVLVVGDTTFDMLMGKGAGTDTCAVTYGNHSGEQLKKASPTFMIDRFDQLLKILS